MVYRSHNNILLPIDESKVLQVVSPVLASVSVVSSTLLRSVDSYILRMYLSYLSLSFGEREGGFDSYLEKTR